MIINGIVAEYNPFHNGHVHHIQTSKELTGADYTIVAMSGNFVQRGAPALMDKYARTRMALEGGADLVLELPAIFAIASSGCVALGGGSLLDHLGVVNNLCFGTESGTIEGFDRIVEILLEEPEDYQKNLKANLRQGMPFPLARTSAIQQYDPSLYDATVVMSSPNNILAIEYLKSLKKLNSAMKPFTVRREGSGYKDQRYINSTGQASALAIRQAVTYGENLASLHSVMPEAAHKLLMDAIARSSTVDVDDFSSMLLYKLIMEKEEGYTRYLDIDEDLSNRIQNTLNQFISITQFCELLKSKERTYTRISRCLFHILLDITDSAIESARMIQYTPYARILGFRKESEALLSEIKAHTRIPIISQLSEAKNKLYEEPMEILRREITIGDIYSAAVTGKNGSPLANDFTTPIVIV